ncbi:MAG TPA: ABC transporter permease, partial [Terriglobales bacterium]|nr:ABC transporter permease [Terriglobales bacterium]
MLALRLALRQLWRFPWRTGLMLACGGLSAALVIAALNYTAAGRALFLGQLDAWGADTLTITPALSRSVGGRARTGAPVTTLRPADLAALLAAAPAISAAAEMATASFLAKAGDLAKNNTAIAGVSAGYFDLRHWPVASGRAFTPAEAREASRLALLGAAVARDLFPDGSPLGHRLFINRVPFTVLGVLAARGQRLDAINEDGQIYIPLLTLQHRLLLRDYDSAFFLAVSPPSAMGPVARQAAALLRRRHHLVPVAAARRRPEQSGRPLPGSE